MAQFVDAWTTIVYAAIRGALRPLRARKNAEAAQQALEAAEYGRCA